MNTQCEVGGCEGSRGKKSRFCGGHQMRWERHGDVMADVPIRRHRPKGSGSVNNRGYVMDRRPGHPLAMRDGRVLRNRAVLFDAIGSGAHPCHWCERTVEWKVDLHADHLDGDKTNNERTNLVPSCPSCNVARGNQGNPTDWVA